MTTPNGGSAEPNAQIQQLWSQTVERVKREVMAPSLWRALERTVPVIIENNTLAVGFAAGDGQLAGTLNSGDYRSAVERALRAVSGNNSLNVRIIEGTALSDWEYAKARDAAAVQQRQQAAQRRYVEAAAFNSWDEIYDQVSRLWANSEYRALASGKARFLDQALGLVQKALDSLAPSGSGTDEQTERGLSRVIERVASYTSSDASLVAYLLLQRQGGSGGGNGS
jgi:hypothetical protein